MIEPPLCDNTTRRVPDPSVWRRLSLSPPQYRHGRQAADRQKTLLRQQVFHPFVWTAMALQSWGVVDLSFFASSRPSEVGVLVPLGRRVWPPAGWTPESWRILQDWFGRRKDGAESGWFVPMEPQSDVCRRCTPRCWLRRFIRRTRSCSSSLSYHRCPPRPSRRLKRDICAACSAKSTRPYSARVRRYL